MVHGRVKMANRPAVAHGMGQIQMAMFLKNISMLGSALFFTQIGTGPLSLDSRRALAP
jgi:uncharacterized membrane protein YphA (DoxX/SURF4 family)